MTGELSPVAGQALQIGAVGVGDGAVSLKDKNGRHRVLAQEVPLLLHHLSRFSRGGQKICLGIGRNLGDFTEVGPADTCYSKPG